MEPDSTAKPLRERVLVVDDQPFFREGIVTWLERQSGLEYCGYADSPRGAMEAIARSNPDLVLLDLQLHHGDGFDLLRTLKDSDWKPRVIVISQKDENLFAERALRAGAHGFVSKDEASDTIAVAIQTVLGGEIYVSPSLRRQLFAKVAASEVTPPPDDRG